MIGELEKKLIESNENAKKVFDMLTDEAKDEYNNLSIEKIKFFELESSQEILVKWIYAKDEDRVLLLMQIGSFINEYKTKFNLNDSRALLEIIMYIESLKVKIFEKCVADEVMNVRKSSNKITLKKKVKNPKLSTIGASAKIIKVDPNKKRKKSLKKK